MSLVDSRHIIPAPRGRHGVHYKMLKRKHDGVMVEGGIFHNPEPSRNDKICDNCFSTAWSVEQKTCWRCGKDFE